MTTSQFPYLLCSILSNPSPFLFNTFVLDANYSNSQFYLLNKAVSTMNHYQVCAMEPLGILWENSDYLIFLLVLAQCSAVSAVPAQSIKLVVEIFQKMKSSFISKSSPLSRLAVRYFCVGRQCFHILAWYEQYRLISICFCMAAEDYKV